VTQSRRGRPLGCEPSSTPTGFPALARLLQVMGDDDNPVTLLELIEELLDLEGRYRVEGGAGLVSRVWDAPVGIQIMPRLP